MASDIASWLEGIGLSEHARLFAENDIDFGVVRDLSEDDFASLGLTLGHRKRLLKAIRLLDAPTDEVDSSTRGLSQTSTRPAGSAPRTAIERRQLTVLFCDLVGSTGLSARLDPEDLQALMNLYRRCIADAVARYRGFVAQHLGDGALVYFGYPLAQENDTERAVLAALELVKAIADLVTKEKLQARIGIATGLVVVGDLSDAEGVTEHGALGETPNLAARLLALAHPGSVVISGRTRQIAGSLFRYRDLGESTVKGFVQPVHVWEVLGAAAASSRSQMLESADILPLIGRDEEIELLARRWERAKGGDGRVVLLSGEAGIGKSRITLGLLEHLATEAKGLLRLFCSPYHASSAFYPFIALMEHLARVAGQDSAAQKVVKLEQMFGDAMSVNDLEVLAELLSIPPRTPIAMSPQQKRDHLMRIFLTQVATLASVRPLLIVFEDVHWIDPTSQELLDRLVEKVRLQPILLVVTGRPEFQPPWVGQAFVTAYALNRLGQAEVGAMVSRMSGGRAIPRDVVEQIVARTDGVPLYVEELTKSILESTSLEGTGGSVQTLIPPTLQASLVARLDRLALAKDIAQIGATIGREFSYQLLADVAELRPKELEGPLEQLVNSGLVQQRGDLPHANFIFKHALVQEAAYQTLLRSRRQQLHGKIAQALLSNRSDLTESQPELFAHHFSESDAPERAIVYWLQASNLAAARSASKEAVSHAMRGLALLRTIPASPERDRGELSFQIVVGTQTLEGYASSEARAAFARARELAGALNDARQLFAIAHGEYLYCAVLGRTRQALVLAQDCRAIADRAAEPSLQVMSHRALGGALMQLGEFAVASEELARVPALYNSERDEPLALLCSTDPRATAAAFHSLTLWARGYPNQASQVQARAIDYASERGHLNTTCHVRMFAGAELDQLLGNVSAVRSHTEALVDIASRHDLRMWLGYGTALRGWALAQENLEDGISLMRRGIETLDSCDAKFHVPHFMCLLADLLFEVGDIPGAAEAVAEARDRVRRSEEQFWEADLQRREGEVCRAIGLSNSKAEALFVSALQIARGQSAKALELRAATSLARFWQGIGNKHEARDLLRPVYTWFTEGFETADLRSAQALLAELE